MTLWPGRLSSSPSWWDSEGRNGQPESDGSHRKAIHHIEAMFSVSTKEGDSHPEQLCWDWVI